MIWLSVLLLQAAAAPTPQIDRGQTLFYAEKGCGTCHALKGRGTAVGPDLRTLGKVGVRALVMAIRASRTEYVQAVKVKKEEPFPGMKVSEDATTAQYYDLSKSPPELRKIPVADIESRTDNSLWKHPAVGRRLHGRANGRYSGLYTVGDGRRQEAGGSCRRGMRSYPSRDSFVGVSDLWPARAASNPAKHAISFEEAATVFGDSVGPR